MSGYSEGARVERIVMHDLANHGYECTRAASSKGSADVVAIGLNHILLVNVKRTTPPGPAERAELLRICGLVGGLVPIVALKPKGRPLEYRRLLGAGPSEWVAWAPTTTKEQM